MKRKVILLSLVIVLLLSHGLCLNAQTYLCFVRGIDYLETPAEQREAYVVGLADMFFLVLSLEFPEYSKKHEEKTRDMGLQIVKIFEKYLEEHPEKLQFAAAGSFFDAMFELVPVD